MKYKNGYSETFIATILTIIVYFTGLITFDGILGKHFLLELAWIIVAFKGTRLIFYAIYQIMYGNKQKARFLQSANLYINGAIVVGVDETAGIIYYIEDELCDLTGNPVIVDYSVYGKKLSRNEIGNRSEKSNPFSVGDTLVINGKELEVAAILSDSPFSSTDIPTVICSEDTFYRITGKADYAIVDIQLTQKANDETVMKIRSIAGDAYKVRDARASNREVNSTYYAFSFLVYSFLELIALITVFNIMNSISMSVSARMKQCGIMRAIGMDKRQVLRMIASEAITYAVCGCFLNISTGKANT